MTEVGVHVDADVEPTPTGQLEALEDRTAQPATPTSDKHVQPRLPPRVFAGDLPGAVGRVVVDDQKLHVGRATEHGVDQVLDVFALVVRGRLHEYTARRPVVTGMEVG